MTNNQPKLLLTAIVKDDSEAEIFKRMLDSFMPYFDGLAVAITGTSKKYTKLDSLITKHGGEYIVTTEKTHPDIYHQKSSGDYMFANFAEARNAVFELASEMQQKEQYTYWSWADTDDVLINGGALPAIAAEADRNDIDAVYFDYWYAVKLDKDGKIDDVMIEHLRERLMRPDMFKWISRLHEVAVPIDENYQPRLTLYEMDKEKGQYTVWAHLPGTERVNANLHRNMELLTLQRQDELSQGKDDPRTLFYLGKTYRDLAHDEPNKKEEYLDTAAEYFEKYLNGDNPSGWEEERSNAWEYLGNIYREKGNLELATECYHEGVKESPENHMLNLMLSVAYFERELVDKAKHWLDVATNLPAPKARTTIGNPLEVKLTAATLKYNIAFSENRIDDAIYWLKIRNELLGYEEGEDEMLKTLEEVKDDNDAAVAMLNYARWLKRKGYHKKVKALLDAVAPEFEKEQFVQQIANEYTEPQAWPKDSIVYFAGPTFEAWSPKSMKRGLGGSESAIVNLSKRWVQKGYSVTVFCDCAGEEGTYEGVTYKPWQQINWRDTFYIFIGWRNPSVFDMDIDAYIKLYDAHDIESQMNWTPERMEKVDKIFFKSGWHRRHIPDLPDSKAAIIHNGIET